MSPDRREHPAVEAASSRLPPEHPAVEAASSRLPPEHPAVEAASSRLPPPPKRQDAASTPSIFQPFDPTAPIEHLSGNLPHLRQPGCTYFVTFRTADSIPQEKLQQWVIERTEWLRIHPLPHSEDDRLDYFRRFPQRLESWLDQGYGACLLARPEIKLLIETALRFFDGQRYDLHEFIVMPNHVHALLTPTNGHELSAILHSWKSFTAQRINKAIGTAGAFWQKESFDHIVRNADYLEAYTIYILSNPKQRPP